MLRPRKLTHTPFAVAILVVLLAACDRSPNQAPTSAPASPSTQPPASSAPAWFEDVTEKRGLRFVHDPGEAGRFFMPEMVGSGVAIFDYDNDGRLDLYFLQNAGTTSPSRNQLFHHEADGTLKNVSAGSGLEVAGRGMGVAVGDVNNDGHPDVLVCEYGGVRLFVNEGEGKFVERTQESGIADPHWASTAAFFDYDRDGWLDLMIVNYVQYNEAIRCTGPNGKLDYCGPSSFPGAISKLFHNLGAAGQGVRFEDVTAQSGLANAASAGLGVVCADFDGDGWPDIFVTNDAEANHLWMNRQDGTFKDEAAVRGIAYNAMGRPQANMGIALGDIEGDGLFDLFVTHLTEEFHALYTQRPAGAFLDRTAATGLAASRWHGTGFGTVFADFDQDGFPDLAVVNGRVRRTGFENPLAKLAGSLGPFWSIYAEQNQLFSNDGTGKFRDVSLANDAFCKTPRVGRGLAMGDLDGDGALDLVTTNVASEARIYRNIAPDRGHWLMVRAVEPALGGRDAYGAKITVVTTERRLTNWIVPSVSYQCSSDPRAHFGLGTFGEVQAIEVTWPDGSTERFAGGAANRVVTLRHGEGTP